MSGEGGPRRTHLHLPLLGRFAPPFGADFVAVEATGSILLVLAVIAALAWANLSAASYAEFWSFDLTIGLGRLAVSRSLHDWVGEGLMTVFFFVLGLELKRELVTGPLRRPRAAALPVGAAIGGAILPALVFAAIVRGRDGTSGWAVPMATDAALALGVLTALGRRVTSGAKSVLLAIAVVDDLIAVLVIAFFLSGGLRFTGLVVVGVVVGIFLAFRSIGLRHPALYVPLGVGLWLALDTAGIHPTVAGAALGLLTPARHSDRGLERIERAVHPWAALLVVPLFALSAVGIPLGRSAIDALSRPVTLGVVLGLVVGKAVGIAGTAAVLVRLRLAEPPPGTGSGELLGVALLGGVGLSVALFITGLALDGSTAYEATIGLLAGSLLSAASGAATLTLVARRRSRAALQPSGSMEHTDREAPR